MKSPKLVQFEKYDKWLILILGMIAILVTVYSILTLRQLFTLYFVPDDFSQMNLGSLMHKNPGAFLTFSLNGWWRLLGFTIPAFTYYIFGLNSLPHHLLAYAVHLGTAISLIFLGQKLFSVQCGLFSYITYVLSPIAVSVLGFSTNVFQDELSALFSILVIIICIRANGAYAKRRHPYWLPAVFYVLAAMCKDSWMGLVPAIIIMDFLNYQHDRLRNRVLRLAPFALVLLIPLARLLLFGFDKFLGVQGLYANANFKAVNLVWGITLPFMPSGYPAEENSLFIFRLIFPLLFLILPWILYPKDRLKIAVLESAFLAFILVLIVSPLNNDFTGWIHFPPVIALGSIIMGMVFFRGASKTPLSRLRIVFAAIWFGSFLYPQYLISEQVGKFWLGIAHSNKSSIDNLKIKLKTLPDGTHVFAFGGPAPEIAFENFVPKSIKYTSLEISKENIEMTSRCANDDRIRDGKMLNIFNVLLSKLNKPKSMVLSGMDGKWIDVTMNFTNINRQDLSGKTEKELKDLFFYYMTDKALR